jgi:crotonobetainyl-CoA:carnitine CoA-transferase CaiB-like acyl-CoA transferase
MKPSSPERPLTGVNILEVTSNHSALPVTIAGRFLMELGATVYSSGRRAPLDPDPIIAARIDHFLYEGKQILPPAVGEVEPRAWDLTLVGVDSAEAYRCTGHGRQVVLDWRIEEELTGRHRSPPPELLNYMASGFGYYVNSDVIEPDSELPVAFPGSVGNTLLGLAGAAAATAALLCSAPQRIVVRLQEVLANNVKMELGAQMASGMTPSRLRVNNYVQTLFETRTGWLFLNVASNPEHWKGFVRAMGNPAWTELPTFATYEDRSLNASAWAVLVAESLAEVEREAFCSTAQENGVPASPVYAFEQFPLHPQAIATSLFETSAGTPLPRGWSNTKLHPVDEPAASNDGAGWQSPTLPLTGVRVLDCTTIFAGPQVSQWLAALGADVVKVESPGHVDSSRRLFSQLPPGSDDDFDSSIIYHMVNSGKKAVLCDLSKPDERAQMERLISRADVFITSHIPNVARKLGFDFASVREVNPTVIWMENSPYGSLGPLAWWKGLGLNAAALTGFLQVVGSPSRRQPVFIGGAWPDFSVSFSALAQILACLYARRRTTLAAEISNSMTQFLSGLLWRLYCESGSASGASMPRGNSESGWIPNEIFRTKDGILLAISADQDAWVDVCRFCAEPDWNDWPPATREQNRYLVEEAVRSRIGRGAFSDLVAELRGTNIRAVKVRDTSDFLSRFEANATGFIDHIRHPRGFPMPMLRLPFTSDVFGRGLQTGRGPLLGEHSIQEVWRDG